jgi:probable HAF family extracellular repeat protein
MHSNYRWTVRSLIVVAVWQSLLGTSVAAEYTVHLLEPIGNRVPRTAVAINNLGVVAGTTHCPGCLSQAFVGDSSYSYSGIEHTTIEDINDAGAFIGTASPPGLDPVRHFSYTPSGGAIHLENLFNGRAAAFGINNAGDIVGYGYVNDQTKHAFLLSGGNLTLFDTTDSAMVINDSGIIAGVGWIRENGVMKPLRFSNGISATPEAINNRGQVVGMADTWLGETLPFLYEDGVMKNLATIIGQLVVPYGINDHGDIIGHYFPGGVAQPFIFKNGQLTNLTTPIAPNSGWTLSRVVDINNRGQIAGNGIFNGEFRAFRLDPIPEPTSLVMLLAIGVVAATARCPSLRRAA